MAEKKKVQPKAEPKKAASEKVDPAADRTTRTARTAIERTRRFSR